MAGPSSPRSRRARPTFTAKLAAACASPAASASSRARPASTATARTSPRPCATAASNDVARASAPRSPATRAARSAPSAASAASRTAPRESASSASTSSARARVGAWDGSSLTAIRRNARSASASAPSAGAGAPCCAASRASRASSARRGARRRGRRFVVAHARGGRPRGGHLTAKPRNLRARDESRGVVAGREQRVGLAVAGERATRVGERTEDRGSRAERIAQRRRERDDGVGLTPPTHRGEHAEQRVLRLVHGARRRLGEAAHERLARRDGEQRLADHASSARGQRREDRARDVLAQREAPVRVA